MTISELAGQCEENGSGHNLPRVGVNVATDHEQPAIRGSHERATDRLHDLVDSQVDHRTTVVSLCLLIFVRYIAGCCSRPSDFGGFTS